MVGPLLRLLSPRYAKLLAWRQLDGVWISGLDQVEPVIARGPVIFAANHVCWWDGQLMLVLLRRLGVDGKFLVNADNVDRMSFLEPLGGIALDRTTVSSTLSAMERGAAWLSGPRKSLWVFPQGRFRPEHVRPLGLQRGVGLLAKMTDAPVIPVAIHYGFLDNHLPACAIRLGAPIEGRDRLMDRVEASLTEQLDDLSNWFDTPERRHSLEPLVKSMVVPIERRLGARFYLAVVDLIGWARGRLSG